MILTHDPFQPTPDSADWDPTTQGEKPMQNPKNFAAMVTFMDKMIGRLDAKLAELGLRDNTLLLFLGDNGTHSRITSQFQGAPYRGGKGTTTRRGTHVPFIASWPSGIREGRVSRDMISTADFLPTLCEAAQATLPDGIDGVSFLPQLQGEKGTAREWLYSWYSPRQRLDLTVREFAHDASYKLYRTGEFYHLNADPDEQAPLRTDELTGDAAAAHHKLTADLQRYQHARPKELDDLLESSLKPAANRGKKRKQNSAN